MIEYEFNSVVVYNGEMEFMVGNFQQIEPILQALPQLKKPQKLSMAPNIITPGRAMRSLAPVPIRINLCTLKGKNANKLLSTTWIAMLCLCV